MSCSTDIKITVGARGSTLSRCQIQEVLAELRQHHPEISFEPILITTTGDFDKKTSLRDLGKSDFFTREIDQFQLSGKCRIAIHSAKDLPEPLPKGLLIAAITKGVDSSDVLVLRSGESFLQLPFGAKIATSSLRREENVRRLRGDFTFIDVRGTIEERLELLKRGVADGVVIAEAALIRLQLTHLNRIALPGATSPLQGQLAVVACEGDCEMIHLFQSIDVRKEWERKGYFI